MYTPTLWLAVVAIIVAAVPTTATEDDKTLSPYFNVYGSVGEKFPLKATKTKVNIAGVIADVVVTQVYTNEGQTPIEADYVFPASTKSAVSGMTMKVGRKLIKAVVQERGKAQQIYDKARSEGKRASLLEQHRANVFQMHVANIMPGDTVEVELRYTELIVPTEGVYRFVYPTVVGPRYDSGTNNELSSSSSWASATHLEAGVLPTATMSLDVHIATGVALHDVSSSTHKFTIARPSPSEADLTLDSSEQHKANRDVVISYRLGGDAVTDGLLLYEEGKEKYFLYMAQPPKRVGRQHIPPREYVFIVDVSGSMNGFPLQVSKELISDLLDDLRPTDKFNILFFAGSSSALSEYSLPATKENIDRAKSGVNHQRAGGGTELLPALRHVVSLPHDEGYSRTIVIATDGFVTVEPQAFDFIRSNLNTANVFTFGIGTSVNRLLIEGMARAGRGDSFIVMNEKEAHITAQRFSRYIASPVLTNIALNFGNFQAYDVVPSTCPDIFSERPVVVFGKWKGERQGAISVKGQGGSGLFTSTQNVVDARPDKRNAALKYLWAREQIAVLGDYSVVGSQVQKEITDLGLEYNLLTAYTSFVGVDSEIANTSGDMIPVSQPVPLPQGVSPMPAGRAAPRASGNSQPQSSGSGQPSGTIQPSGSSQSPGSYQPYNYGGGGGGNIDLGDPLQPAAAPPRLYIGPTMSMVFAYASHTDEPLAFGSFEVSDLASSAEMGWSAGVQAEYLLGPSWRFSSSLLLGVAYTSLPALFSKPVTTPVDFGATPSATADGVYEKQVSLSMLSVSAMYKYMFVGRLSVMAGPSMGLVLDGTETETLTLASDSPVGFVDNESAARQGIELSDNMRSATRRDRDISDINRIQFSLRAGLLYEASIRKWIFAPYVMLAYPLTSVRSDARWKMTTLHFGLQMHYALGRW